MLCAACTVLSKKNSRRSILALTCFDITPSDQFIVSEILIRMLPMHVVWFNVYQAISSVVDSHTTWVKFTSLLALFQRGGPAVLYAANCSFTVTLKPFGRTVDISFSYSCTRNKLTSGGTTLEISGDKLKSIVVPY